MVDNPALTLRAATLQHLLKDRGERVGFTLDGAGEGIAPEGAESHLLEEWLLPGLKGHARIVHHDERAVALHHEARSSQVQGYDGDVFQPDVLPDIEFGPVGERKHPQALTGSLASIVEPPELGALLFRI